MKRRDFIAVAVGAATWARLEEAAADQLVVVVNENVRQSTFSNGELAAIFTTRRRNYENGGRIIPLNLPARSGDRVHFDESVLGMDPDEVARYWIDRKVRGGDPPPKQVPSAALVARLVQKLPGAIGYVPASMAAGLKIIARL
jgi:ABC-type phosphate transport system substrate-binding protein